jgi:hypothetical protein
LQPHSYHIKHECAVEVALVGALGGLIAIAVEDVGIANACGSPLASLADANG